MQIHSRKMNVRYGLLGLRLSLTMVLHGWEVVGRHLLGAHCGAETLLHRFFYLVHALRLFSPFAPISPDVNYEELARCTDDFNGAQCKAVCVEAVSIPLRNSTDGREMWKLAWRNYLELVWCSHSLSKYCLVGQGMIALRRGATELTHEDYMEGILEVQAKKKANLQYYAWSLPSQGCGLGRGQE